MKEIHNSFGIISFTRGMNTCKRRHKFWLIIPFLAFFILLILMSLLSRPNNELASSHKQEKVEIRMN